MLYPALHAGQRNKAVAAMKAGVRRALVAKGIQPRAAENDAYGDLTVTDVRKLKWRYRLLPINGKVVGSRVWKVLDEGGYLGSYDLSRIAEFNREVAAAKAKADAAAVAAAHEVAARVKIAAVAIRVYNERWRYTYSQTRPYSKALFTGGRYYDCSSMATMIYYAAGMPDPNGRGYDGLGYTGTMDSRGTRGRWIFVPSSGDLAFYGPSSDATTHVAVHISRNTVISFGSDPVKQLPLGYRGDYVGSKTFL